MLLEKKFADYSLWQKIELVEMANQQIFFSCLSSLQVLQKKNYCHTHWCIPQTDICFTLFRQWAEIGGLPSCLTHEHYFQNWMQKLLL